MYFRSTIPKDVKVELPGRKDVYNLCKRSNYGGRVQPHKMSFTSSDDQIGKKHSEVNDYLLDLDVCSLYPTVMQKHLYPVGEGRFLKEAQIATAQMAFNSRNLTHLKLGMYNVDVIPNPRLIVPVLPAKNAKGDTCWDLIPRTYQCYCLPDIVEGIKHGYTFKIIKAYVYDASFPIFKKYVDKVFLIKQTEDYYKATKDPRYNPTRRMIAKLLMNSLYGKMSQKPIEDSNVSITSPAEFRKFLREYEWRDMHIMGDKAVAVGKKKNFQACVTRPMQLGSYILAYSRSHMTGLMDLLDPVRLNITDNTSLLASFENTFYYGDTDAMHVHSSHLHKLKDVMYESSGTPPSLNGAEFDPKIHKGKQLGQLDDELGGGKIIEAFYPAPKLYADRALMPDNTIEEKIKGKGIVSYKLSWDDFPKLARAEEVKKSFFFMTKYRLSVPQTMQDKGFDQFSIEGRTRSRTLGKTQYSGRMKFDDGLTLPHGFDVSILK